jgi:hypothetical protein
MIDGASIGSLLLLNKSFTVLKVQNKIATFQFALVLRKEDIGGIRDFDTTLNFGDERDYTPPDGEGDPPDPGFAPLAIMVGAITLGYLSKVAFELWEEYQYGGLIIDLRKAPYELKENSALERGHVIIIGEDGKIDQLKPENVAALERILEKVSLK